jgi:hypothetical protein
VLDRKHDDGYAGDAKGVIIISGVCLRSVYRTRRILVPPGRVGLPISMFVDSYCSYLLLEAFVPPLLAFPAPTASVLASVLCAHGAAWLLASLRYLVPVAANGMAWHGMMMDGWMDGWGLVRMSISSVPRQHSAWSSLGSHTSPSLMFVIPPPVLSPWFLASLL